MFVYNDKLLMTNVDDAVIQVKVARGVPFGSRVHKIFYVSITYDIL